MTKKGWVGIGLGAVIIAIALVLYFSFLRGAPHLGPGKQRNPRQPHRPLSSRKVPSRLDPRYRLLRHSPSRLSPNGSLLPKPLPPNHTWARRRPPKRCCRPWSPNKNMDWWPEVTASTALPLRKWRS